MSGSYLLAGVRTPIGRLSGAMSACSAVDLGAHAVAAALARAGVSPEDVDHVVMGQVLQAGQGQCSARQVAVAAGIPMDVPATLLNRVCLSGLSALHYADLLISSGEANIVVAGGIESMSNAPHLLPGARDGVAFGQAALFDAIEIDGLTCAFEGEAMGTATDRHAAEVGISRERQDELALRSHVNAANAWRDGRFAEEVLSICVTRGRVGIDVSRDEGIREDTTLERLQSLRPAFVENGTVTAGNASQLSDGAVALIVVAPHVADQIGITPLAQIVAYGQVAGPDASLLYQPARALEPATKQVGLAVGDLEVVEINEAFAAVLAASLEALDLPLERVNPNGGAIALGHPLGMSGARLALTLALELRRRGGIYGAAALCGGGGQGDAVVLRSVT